MDIAKSLEKRIGLKKQVVSSKGLEGAMVINTSKMKEQEKSKEILL